MNDTYLDLLQLQTENKLPIDLQRLSLYNYAKERKLEPLFDRLYNSANEHLQFNMQNHRFPPSYLLVENNLAVNGAAGTRPEYKVILITAGVICSTHAFFEEQLDIINETASTDIKNVLKVLGGPVADIFTTYLWAFVYYHEYGHLLQQRRMENADYSEEPRTIASGEVPESHAKEMDADWYAMNEMAWIITNFFRDENGNWKNATKQDLEGLASIALSSIFCFFVKAAGVFPVMYFEKEVHPHPLIRLAFISQLAAKTIKENIPSSIEYDETKVLYDTLELSEKLLERDYGHLIQDISNQFDMHFQDMNNYGNKILELAVSMPDLARNYLSP